MNLRCTIEACELLDAFDFAPRVLTQQITRLYNNIGKTYLFDLDFWHLRHGLTKEEEKDWKSKYSMDAYHVGNVSPL